MRQRAIGKLCQRGKDILQAHQLLANLIFRHAGAGEDDRDFNRPFKEAALEVGMPYITEKWMGGTMTNFAIIKKLIKKFKDLTRDKNSGKLTKYTKKERLEFDREITKLELKVGGLVSLTKMPDAIFIWDITRFFI